jgi:hypothetical protein
LCSVVSVVLCRIVLVQLFSLLFCNGVGSIVLWC